MIRRGSIHVLLLGEAGLGKSCLLRATAEVGKFTSDAFLAGEEGEALLSSSILSSLGLLRKKIKKKNTEKTLPSRFSSSFSPTSSSYQSETPPRASDFSSSYEEEEEEGEEEEEEDVGCGDGPDGVRGGEGGGGAGGGVYVCGNATSAAGLTAALVKDSQRQGRGEGGEFVVEAGRTGRERKQEAEKKSRAP